MSRPILTIEIHPPDQSFDGVIRTDLGGDDLRSCPYQPRITLRYGVELLITSEPVTPPDGVSRSHWTETVDQRLFGMVKVRTSQIDAFYHVIEEAARRIFLTDELFTDPTPVTPTTGA